MRMGDSGFWIMLLVTLATLAYGIASVFWPEAVRRYNEWHEKSSPLYPHQSFYLRWTKDLVCIRLFGILCIAFSIFILVILFTLPKS